jgi:hypothetical protein
MAKKKESKKPKMWVLQAVLISQLRRLFVRSPLFQATRKDAQEEKVVYNKDGTQSKQRRVHYRCAICGEFFDDCKTTIESTDKRGKVSKKKVHQIAVDHTEPFVPLEGLPKRENGLPDWNVLIDRMFLGVVVWNPESDTYDRIKDRARLLCHECHGVVTAEQNRIRRELKKQADNSEKPEKKTKKNK